MEKPEVHARVLAGTAALGIFLPFFDSLCVLYTDPFVRPAFSVAAWLLVAGVGGGLSAGYLVWLVCREPHGSAAHFTERVADGLLRHRLASVVVLLLTAALLSNGIAQRVRPKWWNLAETRELANRAMRETATKFHFGAQDFSLDSVSEDEGIPVFHYIAEKEGCIYSFRADVYPVGKVVGYPGTAGSTCHKDFVQETTFTFAVSDAPPTNPRP